MSLAFASGVLGSPLLVLREIAVVELFHIEGDKAPVHRLSGELAIGLFEPQADLPEAGRAVVVVDAVMGDSVNEEQREVKLPRFRGVELDVGDYGSVVTASIAAS